MKINHPKIYYVGGLISLIFLPILFFISTNEYRKRAIHYGSIEVRIADDRHIDFYKEPPELLYVFLGNDETLILSNFQQYCQSYKQNSRTIQKLYLPENCSYNFFIQVLDILHVNKFVFGLDHQTIRFTYRPDLDFRQECEPASTAEEFQYVFSELTKIFSALKEYFSDEPRYSVRILKYSDLGPPPSLYGPFFYPANYEKTKEEPRSSLYFRTIGLWFVPIILLWLLLFILSIKRNRKLLPNQALPPNKTAGTSKLGLSRRMHHAERDTKFE
jgi:hypothetical protein